MREILLFLVLLLTGTLLNAQTSISGKVQDTRNRPVTGATILLKDTYDGGTSDSLGRFSFGTVEKGNLLLVISALGYKSKEVPFTTSTQTEFLVVLKEEVNEMQAVVISAGSFEASDRKRATVLSSIDMLTTASANADVSAAVKTLPGAQQVGESEGLFVRGGTASETRTYIDGSLVNNFFYSSVPNISQRGRFSPWMFKGTVFSAGGYSALYGQALSSALILESTDLPEMSSGNLGISFLSASGGYQRLAKNKRSSWGASYSYTNLDLVYRVLKQKPDYFKMPEFHTGDANFRIKTSSTGILKYYGYFSQNRVGLRNWSIDSLDHKEAFRLKNLNLYHNLSWREYLANRWKLNLGMSYSNNRDAISGTMQDAGNRDVILEGLESKNFILDARGAYYNAKIVVEKGLKGLSALRFGAEYNFSNDKTEYQLYNGSLTGGSIRENLTSAFAETDLYITNRLAAKIGGRVEHSTLLDSYNFAPRISFAYKTGKETQASFAYGIFYQNPEKRYLPATKPLEFTKATHYILQFQKLSSKQTFRAEIFYKKYDDLLKTALINHREVAVGNGGKGYARGFEFFYRDKKSIPKVDYWISYSYLDTEREFLNYPTPLQPNFVARHTANLVVKKFVTGLKTMFNANYVFASGRPYYNIRYDNTGSKTEILDQGKTIPYNSLSLSLNYLPNVFKKGAGKSTVFVFSYTNVLGSKQVFGYHYSMNGLRKEAIVPPAKSFIFIGAFISFGVDRSDDVINSNL